jgi:stage II sporulation protein R
MNKEFFLGNTLANDRRKIHMKEKENKISLILVLLFLFVLSVAFAKNENKKSDRLQEGIAKEIIRFHVIANSDSKEDQKLKLEIKEVVVKKLQGSLKSVKNINEARDIIDQELDNIEKIASEIAKEKGYTYKASAELTKCTFPIKKYGDMIFPPGEYETLRVKIGQSEGKNWWCVMFPTLCFIDGTYSVVPKESKEELKMVLTKEEYESLLTQGKNKVTVKFKIVELWMKLWS